MFYEVKWHRHFFLLTTVVDVYQSQRPKPGFWFWPDTETETPNAHTTVFETKM